jgi:hypothetical protein
MGLFGPATAAFYADACQLVAHDPQLATTTHLVGHLLRELESALRDVLRPMLPPEQTTGSTKLEGLLGRLLRKAASALQALVRPMVPAELTSDSAERTPVARSRRRATSGDRHDRHGAGVSSRR